MPQPLNGGRLQHIDRMRLFAVLLLMLFHTGMLFSFRDWYMNNGIRSIEITYALFFSGNFRLTLLFFASGYLARHISEKKGPAEYAAAYFCFSAAAMITGVLLLTPIQILLENSASPGRVPWVFDFYPRGLLSLHHLWFIFYLWGCILLLVFLCRFAAPLLAAVKRYPVIFCIIALAALAQLQAHRGFGAGDARDTLGSPFAFAGYLAHFLCGFALYRSRVDTVFSWPIVIALIAAGFGLSLAYSYLRLFSVHHDATWMHFLSQGAKACTNVALLVLFLKIDRGEPSGTEGRFFLLFKRQIWFIYFWHQPLVLCWAIVILPAPIGIGVKFAGIIVATVASLYLLLRLAMLLPLRARPFVACK